jgi:hypothetical protein
MLGLLLNPLVLCVLVWIVARSTADISFVTMFFIALGVGIVGALLGFVLPGFLGLLSIIPVGLLLVFLLMKYCALTIQQALIVTGLYFAYQILLTLAIVL